MKGFTALLFALMAAPCWPGQDDADSLAAAFEQGQVTLGLRYRYEWVSEDALPKDAAASTLRSTLGLRTQWFRGWAARLEFENVTVAGNDDLYANAGAGSLDNGVVGRPVIADPAGTEVNQAVIAYRFGETTVELGRQELLLGNERFVGPVGWRQNHQSFDALALSTGALDGGGRFSYAYIDKINRIFGDGQPINAHLFDGRWQRPSGMLAAYVYLLDYDRPADSGLSTATAGIGWDGHYDLEGDREIIYAIEAAHQMDYGDNPANVDVEYLRLEVGAGAGRFSAGAGYELLGAGPGDGRFTTPLATLHKFNGWADRFLLTPGNGLQDIWIHADWQSGPWKFVGALHRFQSDFGGLDYGRELDLLLSWKSAWNQIFAVEAAYYGADTFSSDTGKLMFWTEYRFEGP